MQGSDYGRTGHRKKMDEAEAAYQETRRQHWDKVALSGREAAKGLRRAYQRYLHKKYQFLVPAGLRVLEIGCAEGGLLAALAPKTGVGVDFSAEMIALARAKHPSLRFFVADAQRLSVAALPPELREPFDVIILSDTVNDVWDVAGLLQNVKSFCSAGTRIIFNFHSHLWEHPFQFLQRRGLVTPRLPQNWLTRDDMAGILSLNGFEVVQAAEEFLSPFATPLVEPLLNRWIAKLWPFSIFCLIHFLVARLPMPAPAPLKVSVVIPARNEAGNIEAALQRTPDMGAETEIIFVEGGSSDDTWDSISRMAEKYRHRKITALRQTGRGKGDAVRCGFAAAQGDVLMILDADLTMPPESLPQFYEALASGKAEFANGVRLVYPQEKEAMRFCNLIANKFFSLAFSWLLSRSVKDTLCGTKALSRKHYRQLIAGRRYFGDFDPFGDFDLLFGAAKLNLQMKDIPIRYRERTYGDTNISRWSHGWLLLKMVCFAAAKIKFAP
jgi:SAM-dependent methyltransferase